MIVSPGYFRVFGIRSATGESPERLGQTLSGLREGREMILSADLASKLYGHTDVIGAEIYNYNDTVPCHVIAVTEPVRNSEYDSGISIVSSLHWTCGGCLARASWTRRDSRGYRSRSASVRRFLPPTTPPSSGRK